MHSENRPQTITVDVDGSIPADNIGGHSRRTEIGAPSQQAMEIDTKTYFMKTPAVTINNKTYYEQPEGQKGPFLGILLLLQILGQLLIAFLGKHGIYVGSTVTVAYATIGALLCILIMSQSSGFSFVHSREDVYEFLEPDCLDREWFATRCCLRSPKTTVMLDGTKMGYIKKAERYENGCCYAMGCKCSGQAVTWKIYVNDEGETKLMYTLRDDLSFASWLYNLSASPIRKVSSCVPSQLGLADCADSIGQDVELLSSLPTLPDWKELPQSLFGGGIVVYIHRSEDIYGADLADKTAVGEVKWLKANKKLLSVGSTLNSGYEKTEKVAAADAAMRTAMPILLDRKKSLPSMLPWQRTGRTLHRFMPAREVV
jgi:hypothetical protein